MLVNKGINNHQCSLPAKRPLAHVSWKEGKYDRDLSYYSGGLSVVKTVWKVILFVPPGQIIKQRQVGPTPESNSILKYISVCFASENKLD